MNAPTSSVSASAGVALHYRIAGPPAAWVEQRSESAPRSASGPEAGQTFGQTSGQTSGQAPGQPPVLLCLHGHPGSAACMEVFTDVLSQRFLTIAPDLRGYGKSRAPASFAMADHLSDLEMLLEQCGVQDFMILGWSLGGILAMELALRHPGRVRGLILVATSACPWGDHPHTGWSDDVLTGIAALINLIAPGWQWNIDTFGRRSLLRYLVQRHTPETYRFLARYAVSAFLQTSSRANQALNQALRSRYNRLEAIEQIPCPALVLAGAGDRHINAASSLKTAKHLPHCRTKVYDRTAHLFPWEIPQEVLQDIQTWLAEVQPKAQPGIQPEIQSKIQPD